MVDLKKFYSICARAHALAGCLTVLISFMFFWWKGMCIGATVVVVWATIKEVWWDEKYEESDERGDGWRDFFEYAAGAATGLLICSIKLYFL